MSVFSDLDTSIAQFVLLYITHTNRHFRWRY